MTSPILVTGATGTQGGATVRRLLAEGRPVRALVRDPAAPAAVTLAAAGAHLVRGDLDDPASLSVAVDGVAGVFVVPPVAFRPADPGTNRPAGPDTDREAARGRALIDAAVQAGVEQVVLSTVASASAMAAGSAAKGLIEQHLRERVALPTVLRPVRFMTNYLGAGVFGIDGIVDGVHRHLFPPDEPMQIIAPEDIAEFAALAFADPARFAGRTLELAGDDPTPVEAAAAITEATGIPVGYRRLTEAEAAAAGPPIAEIRRRWGPGNRWHADIEALRVIHPGLRTLAAWLNESGADAIRRTAGPPRRPGQDDRRRVGGYGSAGDAGAAGLQVADEAL